MVAEAAAPDRWVAPPESREFVDRLAAGKAARLRTPRSAHARWEPGAGRFDPVDVLQKDDETRLPQLVPVRYARMVPSPFTFYRGAASIMARDLAQTPISGMRTQICGDCHLLNFGAFATPERNYVFDVNDFDETAWGPWEFDVKRLATSFVIAGRHLELRPGECEAAALAALRSYRERIYEYAGRHVLDVWYARLDELALAQAVHSAQERHRLGDAPTKARSATSAHLFPRITDPERGRRRIVDQPPLLFHPADDAGFMENVRATFGRYRDSLPDERRALFDRFRLVDAAYKVVGVGSVGTRCWIALFLADEDDPLVLQVKEARASVHEPFVGESGFRSEGERVVVGQRLMQAASDVFLGWSRDDEGHDYYFRQLRDLKTSANIDRMTAGDLRQYAVICGWALARAHAKAGGESAMIAGYLGRGDLFDRAVLAFAHDYADQNERDYAALLAAVKAGRIVVANSA
ncbi:MAG: DUF2252 domain-containing protein [Candidatus Baltobacteraceae bacterium]|jgi:uncharacterized protein (DUF2252 family)